MKCDRDLLWTLVEQNAEPGAGSDTLAEHLEICDTCRGTLAEIGGDSQWWDDARTWLSSETQNRLEETPQPIDLGFLDEPSHPEMLGRIGRYEVEGVLGRGGMGVVLRAFDSDLQRSVAVKVMAPEWATSFEARQRFAREAQAAASVAHDNVIPIYNVESEAKLPYLVMRYVPGMTLHQWIMHHGIPDVATILRVAGQMADGLQAAHRRGLVHRDVKPGNVLVGENIERVWITDFGLARAADSVTLSQTGVIAGTPHYMSPEQARGEAIDHRSDLFSFGCVLFFLSTGQPPFDADNTLAVLHQIVSKTPRSLTEFRDDLPPRFVRLVHDLLQRPVARRPQDCGEVTEAIDTSQDELRNGIKATRPPLATRIPRGVLIAFATVFVLVAGALWMMRNRGVLGRSGGSAFVVDPWSTGGEQAPVAVDQYIADASSEINQQIVLDEISFKREVKQILLGLDRLEQAMRVVPAPTTNIPDRDWQEQLRLIEVQLSQMQSR